MFWMIMELNLVVFLSTIYFSKKLLYEKREFVVGLYYFIFQSLGRILFLLSFRFKEHFSWMRELFFFSSIFLKIGLFPFFFWVYNFGSYSSNLRIYFILTLQKLPIFLILFRNFSRFTLYGILFSFVFGSIIIFFRTSYVNVFISSSISSSLWVFLIFLDNLFLFFIFFLSYSLFLFLFFVYLDLGASSLVSYSEFLMLIPVFIFLSGLPPIRLFFFKVEVSWLIYYFFSSIEFFIFWILRFLALLGYLSFFFSRFFFNKFLYLKHDYGTLKISFFFFVIIFSSFFVT